MSEVAKNLLYSLLYPSLKLEFSNTYNTSM